MLCNWHNFTFMFMYKYKSVEDFRKFMQLFISFFLFSHLDLILMRIDYQSRLKSVDINKNRQLSKSQSQYIQLFI